MEKMEVVHLAIGELTASDENGRRTPISPRKRQRMASSLEAVGLLQAPVVRECEAGPEGPRYEVMVGRTRVTVLKELAGDPTSRWLPTDKIPCMVKEYVPEMGLAENLARGDMSPVDVHDVLERLYREGRTVADIRQSQGLTEEELRAYRTIGALHPAVREAARMGEIGKDRIHAYASCPDPERQHRHWNEHGTRVSVREVREALADEGVPCDHPSMLLVGIAEYERRGGEFSDDIFSREDDETLYTHRRAVSTSLLQALVEEKLTEEAERAAEEGGFAGAGGIATNDQEVMSLQELGAVPAEAVPDGERGGYEVMAGIGEAGETRSFAVPKSEEGERQVRTNGAEAPEQGPPAVWVKRGRERAHEKIAETIRLCEEEDLHRMVAEEISRISIGHPTVLKRTANQGPQVPGGLGTLDPEDFLREAFIKAMSLDDPAGFTRIAKAMEYDALDVRLTEEDLKHVHRPSLAGWIQRETGEARTADWIRQQDPDGARKAVAALHQGDVETVAGMGLDRPTAEQTANALRTIPMPGAGAPDGEGEETA